MCEAVCCVLIEMLLYEFDCCWVVMLVYCLTQMAMLLKLQEAANYIESPEKELDHKLPTL